MTWDKNRPIAPFQVHGEHTIAYQRGEPERMETFAYCTLSKDDIDKVWRDGKATYQELCGGSSYAGLEFRPFKNVELELIYDTFGRGRSGITFWWKDKDNRKFPMFAAEVDRLIRAGIMSNRIGGLWSAEKRGQNYGIRLERLLWRSSSNADEQKAIS